MTLTETKKYLNLCIEAAKEFGSTETVVVFEKRFKYSILEFLREKGFDLTEEDVFDSADVAYTISW